MKEIILKILKVYQETISPNHGLGFFGGAIKCRFYPSCSQYTYEAIESHGVGQGVIMGLWRILRCNPLSKGGVDPV